MLVYSLVLPKPHSMKYFYLLLALSVLKPLLGKNRIVDSKGNKIDTLRITDSYSFIPEIDALMDMYHPFVADCDYNLTHVI